MPYEPFGCHPAKVGNDTCPKIRLADTVGAADATGICAYVVTTTAAGEGVTEAVLAAVAVAMSVGIVVEDTGAVETIGEMTPSCGIYSLGVYSAISCEITMPI